jgi:hypothetical protein
MLLALAREELPVVLKSLPVRKGLNSLAGTAKETYTTIIMTPLSLSIRLF